MPQPFLGMESLYRIMGGKATKFYQEGAGKNRSTRGEVEIPKKKDDFYAISRHFPENQKPAGAGVER